MIRILVLGSTGYVGGRLIPRLLEAGYQVRAAARSLEKINSRPWAKHPALETIQAHVFDLPSLQAACKEVNAVFYLVHSMNTKPGDFSNADRIAAQNLVSATKDQKVQRIIYLGGLGEDHPDLSKHLRSRIEVAEVLKQGSVPVTVLRAAMIIGSGSASFEILRYLVERLPVMITPRWVVTPNQPIGIRNVIEYLVGTLQVKETIGKSFDIGGSEVLTYLDLMRIYAEEAKLRRRLIITVPVLTPRLSSYWIHLVTPVPASIARPLAEGLRNPVVCRNNEIRNLIPQKLLSCREAIQLALENQEQEISSWTDAGKYPNSLESVHPGDPSWAGGTLFKDQRVKFISASSDSVWKTISSIGGINGWYHADWLWRLRGAMDKLIGGVGLRRGRRDSKNILPGDALDFWRVEKVEAGKYLSLIAEMKLPGEAMLTFQVVEKDLKSCELIQTAYFRTRGLLGIIYWCIILPFHHYIFQGMIEKITLISENKHKA